MIKPLLNWATGPEICSRLFGTLSYGAAGSRVLSLLDKYKDRRYPGGPLLLFAKEAGRSTMTVRLPCYLHLGMSSSVPLGASPLPMALTAWILSTVEAQHLAISHRRSPSPTMRMTTEGRSH